jgi:hypothetical protein
MLERHNLEDGKWKKFAKIFLNKKTQKNSKRIILISRKVDKT